MVNQALRIRIRPISVILSLLLIVSATYSHAQATATLSADVVSEFESVTLTVTDRSRNESDPDFSSLESDFEITQVSTSSSIQIEGGRVDSTRKWQLELMPKRTGAINIPPLVVGNSRTNSLRLRVNPISDRERDYISRTAFFETIVTPEEQYPQAAIYVTRRMLYTSQARIPSMPQEKKLDIVNATVLPIGNRETLREVRNGIEYYVMQWRYVIFAEKSGSMRIPGENARVAIYGNQFRPQIRPIVAPEKTITILPIPDSYPTDEPWFPASRVELAQSFEPSGTYTLNLGDALTRSIELRARDSYQSALLPLELGSIEDVRVYPEQATLDSILDNGRVWGTQSRSFNLVPIEPGRVTLPEFQLTWWDTDARDVKVATLPSATFIVPDPRSNGVSSDVAQILDPSLETQPNLLQTGIDEVSSWIYFLVVVAIVGWLTVFTLLYLNRERLLQRFRAKSFITQVDYGAIRHALSHSDRSTLRHAILHTVAQHLDVDLVSSRRLFLDSDNGHQLLTQLDQLAYNESTIEFDYDMKTIQQVIDSIVKNYASNSEAFGLQSVLN
ncbi:MAG: BatD family protein [Gammaproteobacteria bacterium]|nr:BatD family protein [Gammaproteobacteria bacterium]